MTAAKDAAQQRARVLRVGFDRGIAELAEIDADNFRPPLIQLLADGAPVRVDNHELSVSMPPEILPLAGGGPLFSGEVGDRIVSVLHDDHVALLRPGGAGQIWALIPIGGSAPSATGPVAGQSLSPGGAYQLLQPHVGNIFSTPIEIPVATCVFDGR